MLSELVENCPICNSTVFTPFLSCKDHTVTRETFQIKKCTSCQLVLTSPRPTLAEVGKYYQSDNYISHTGGSEKITDKIYLTVRRITLENKRKIIEANSSKGKLLDYGCGTGAFLNHCIQNGWDGMGVEPSEKARSKAETLIGVSQYENISQLSENQFDAITLWHVLEHVHDLNEKLSSLSALLKTKGTIFIAVPNRNAWDAIHYKENWAAYDVPRHLWHFTKENMAKLLQKQNLNLTAIKPMKFDSFYVSLLSEGYQNPQSSSLTKFSKAFYNGLKSNVKARNNMNYSSLIYIAKK